MKKFDIKTQAIAFAWFFVYFIMASLLYALAKPVLQKIPVIGAYFP